VTPSSGIVSAMPAATTTRYEDAVKLDRAAMKVRDELRKGRPNQARLRAELNRARRALDKLEGS
jgi:hypothetical protein